MDVTNLRSVPSSSRDKDLKKKFLYPDAMAITGDMAWRNTAPKKKVKDIAPASEVYLENALFKDLSPSEWTVVLEGALVLVEMSQSWKNPRLYPGFKTVDGSRATVSDAPSAVMGEPATVEKVNENASTAGAICKRVVRIQRSVKENHVSTSSIEGPAISGSRVLCSSSTVVAV
ncbi:hypothetical protein Hanom_Chr07g00612501 [Helianthus anomalus]